MRTTGKLSELLHLMLHQLDPLQMKRKLHYDRITVRSMTARTKLVMSNPHNRAYVTMSLLHLKHSPPPSSGSKLAELMSFVSEQCRHIRAALRTAKFPTLGVAVASLPDCAERFYKKWVVSIIRGPCVSYFF